MTAIAAAIAVLLITPPAAADPAGPRRSLDDLFPALTPAQRDAVFTADGLLITPDDGDPLTLIPQAAPLVDLPAKIPGGVEPAAGTYLAESLMVIPYGPAGPTLLDGYNALSRVSRLKGRLYHSHTKDADVPLFEEAARIAGPRGAAVPDPPPAAAIPASETVHIRLKDANFGASYYQAGIAPAFNGLLFSLFNSRALTWLLFPVMKAEKFHAALYIEPLREGMMVLSLARAEVSGFVASQVDIPSAIGKRLAVFIAWARDGMTD